MRHSGRDLRLRESMRRPIGDSTSQSPPHTTGKFFVVLERGEERTGELVISSQKITIVKEAMMQDCFLPVARQVGVSDTTFIMMSVLLGLASL